MSCLVVNTLDKFGDIQNKKGWFTVVVSSLHWPFPTMLQLFCCNLMQPEHHDPHYAGPNGYTSPNKTMETVADGEGLKLNVDAAVKLDTRRTGIGAIIRRSPCYTFKATTRMLQIS
uniref:Uncharacterized protein n=1 Tax=Cannabis sativa TaxID=3483 RepID=A0A803QEH3_CANSA